MVIKIHNLNECIEEFANLSDLEDSIVGKVFTRVDYAIYQEFGFSVKKKDGSVTNVPPKRYLRGALEINTPQINENVASYLKDKTTRGKKFSLQDPIMDAVMRVQRSAKAFAPYDTGKLERSITSEVHKG